MRRRLLDPSELRGYGSSDAWWFYWKESVRPPTQAPLQVVVKFDDMLVHALAIKPVISIQTIMWHNVKWCTSVRGVTLPGLLNNSFSWIEVFRKSCRSASSNKSCTLKNKGITSSHAHTFPHNQHHSLNTFAMPTLVGRCQASHTEDHLHVCPWFHMLTLLPVLFPRTNKNVFIPIPRSSHILF